MDEVVDDEERNKAKAALGEVLAVVKSDYNDDLKKVTADQAYHTWATSTIFSHIKNYCIGIG